MPSIDFNNIASKIVPFQLRKSRVIDYLKSLLKPLVFINNLFSNAQIKIDKDVLYTGQIIYLERLLNDLYDNTIRGIYIQDVANISKTYLHNRIEVRPPYYLYNRSESEPPKYLKNRTEYFNNNRFTIHVPSSVTFQEIQMRSVVDKYKQAGVNYTIQII